MVRTLSIYEFKKNLVWNIAKISIIGIFSVVVIANFVPYYEATHDSYVYALKAKSLLEGSWEISTKELTDTGEWEFVPNSWKKTIHDTAIPKYAPGISSIASISYLIAGNIGLFFLGPLLGISFLIICDRVATNLFGKEVGLMTILLLATNGIIFVGSVHLLSDNIFASLIVLGFFCIIKFMKDKNQKYLFFASLSLSVASFIRLSGIFYLPIEIGVVGIFLAYYEIKKRNNSKENNVDSKNSINFYKLSIVIFIPWLFLIVFFAVFNNHYFGDPLTTFYNVPGDPWVKPGTGSYLSIFNNDPENFEVIKGYSNFVLPYPIYKIEIMNFEKILQERNDLVTSLLVKSSTNLIENNMLGILTIMIISGAVIFSFFKTTKKNIIIIFSVLIFSNILFWSAGHISFGRDSIMGRYMVPTFPFFSMIISYFIISWLKYNLKSKSLKRLIILSLKIFTIIVLILFFTIAYYNSPIGQWGIRDNFEVREIQAESRHYPIDLEGLDKNSIIVGGHSAKTIDYGFSTFDPFSGTPSQRVTAFNPEFLDPVVMEKLRELVENRDNVFLYKELLNKNDKIFREFLITEKNYVLTQTTKSFCKIEIVTNTTSNPKSDPSCIGTTRP